MYRGKLTIKFESSAIQNLGNPAVSRCHALLAEQHRTFEIEPAAALRFLLGPTLSLACAPVSSGLDAVCQCLAADWSADVIQCMMHALQERIEELESMAAALEQQLNEANEKSEQQRTAFEKVGPSLLCITHCFRRLV